MDGFIVCLNGFCLAVPCVLHILFTSSLTGKRRRAWHFAAYFLLVGIFDWAANRIALPWIAAIGGELLILYGMNRFVWGNRRSVSWIAAILAIYISLLSFGIVNSAESVIFPHFIGKPLLYLLVLLVTVAAFVICACCYIAVLKSVSLEEDGQASDTGLLLFPVLFFFTAELYIRQTAYTQQTLSIDPSAPPPLAESGKHIALLSLQALGLGALLCTLYAYRHIRRGFQAQAALISLTQAAQAQKIYVAEAQARYGQTKAFRHDIKNHLSVLDGLLSDGKPEEAKAYLQKLETASASLSFPCQTGNPVVDILLGEKLGLAKASGIETEVSLLLPNPCGIDDFDLCVIFANALDNAIRACQSAEGARSIRVTGKQQGDFYMLGFENTCPAGPLPPPGTGLSNIKTVAGKYHGAMLAEKSGCRFCLNVLLDISLHPESISLQKP